MLFSRPSDTALYDALLNRDPSWDGRMYVGVTSTGIFCRLSCPARKPKAENCRFHETASDCLSAGFRPCKRCKPLEHGMEPLVADLSAKLHADPGRRWREDDLIALGLDPSTVRRAFKRQLGVTFLELARMRRLQEGFTALGGGERVIDAQLTANFDSASGFRSAVSKLLGLAPGAFREDARLRCAPVSTPLGPMIAIADDHHLHLLEFMDRKALATELKRLAERTPGGLGFGRTETHSQVAKDLEDYFNGRLTEFQASVKFHGSPFSQAVWRELQTIPIGQTRSYSQIAEQMGRPSAVRAVARANGENQLALIIPCHRVIGADGSLTGYGGGLHRKRALLDLEQRAASLE